ncbi:CidA/LrgA family protein [Endozoicomonas sp. 8E]|uniref:CidA/LrgA family protein n=1 Tax=Endozoicomonas sp. 8E TaxID=3035692 RepID=UPI00293952F3|nr:CidA/LrgA family protein [Endozoicomonas sp. 8E]WOG27631.1 CidA/LrgA family protein [Endozoicomonas sp. 8E]
MKIAFLCQRMAAWLSSVIILMACLWTGDLFSVWINHALPGSIIGMLLLAALLGSGLIRLSWVEAGAGFLVRWMSLLFVPIGVGVINQLELLANSLGALLLTSIFGTLVIMAIAGWLFQWLERTRQ